MSVDVIYHHFSGFVEIIYIHLKHIPRIKNSDCHVVFESWYQWSDREWNDQRDTDFVNYDLNSLREILQPFSHVTHKKHSESTNLRRTLLGEREPVWSGIKQSSQLFLVPCPIYSENFVKTHSPVCLVMSLKHTDPENRKNILHPRG